MIISLPFTRTFLSWDMKPSAKSIRDWRLWSIGETHREGVVYYLREGRVRGVLLWNVWDQVDAARR